MDPRLPAPQSPLSVLGTGSCWETLHGVLARRTGTRIPMHVREYLCGPDKHWLLIALLPGAWPTWLGQERRYMLSHPGIHTYNHPLHPMPGPPTPQQFIGMSQGLVRASPTPVWSHGASEQLSSMQDTSLAPRAFFNSKVREKPLDPPGDSMHSLREATRRQSLGGNVSTRNPKRVVQMSLSPRLCPWQTLLADPHTFTEPPASRTCQHSTPTRHCKSIKDGTPLRTCKPLRTETL